MVEKVTFEKKKLKPLSHKGVGLQFTLIYAMVFSKHKTYRICSHDPIGFWQKQMLPQEHVYISEHTLGSYKENSGWRWTHRQKLRVNEEI